MGTCASLPCSLRRSPRKTSCRTCCESVAILPQFLTSNNQNCNFTSVFDVQRPFRAKGLSKSQFSSKSQFYLSFGRPTSISCEKVVKIAIFLKIAILPQFLTSNVHFVRKGCDGFLKIAILPQFLTSNVHFVRKSCGGFLKIAILPQFLTSNVHFVRNGCGGPTKIVILPQFLTSNVHFVRKGCDGHLKIAILPQFLTSNVHFVRKGCVSWRSGGTAPALRER